MVISGSAAGLGLRRALVGALEHAPAGCIDFLECAPENWIGVGGRRGAALRRLAERFPLTCHGLSLSLGGFAPLSDQFLGQLKHFLEQHAVALYSEHLSYCGDEGYLYDLVPLPFTDEAVRHVAKRIRQVQDALRRRIAVENISYYAAPYQALSELEFVSAVVSEADCDLLLDVNNVYVNSINHGYDPRAFIDGLPTARVVAMHVAGHFDEADDLKIDTHGASVKDDVWSLLAYAYSRCGACPTVLERDFNIPPLEELLLEVRHMRAVQAAAARFRSSALEY
jgi:uncharacterized protein